MHMELDNQYSGFLRQFRRTRANKRLASVSRTFFCRIFTEFEVLNASSTSTYSKNCPGSWSYWNVGLHSMTAIIFGVSQSATPRAWNRLQTSGSATQCHAQIQILFI